MNRKFVFFVSFVIFCLFSASAFGEILTLYGKKIAFYMDDRSGNFYVENPNPRSKSYKQLLFKDDPPSSYVTAIIDGKPYKIGELKTVKPFAVNDNVLSGNFKLNNTAVHIQYILTNLSDREYDSIVCMISYQNPVDPQILVGARLLFDTVAGESQKKPSLYLSSSERIDYDRMIVQNNLPAFILSGAYEMDNPDFGYGLFIYPNINELKPKSLIVANWKRLDEKELAFTIDPLAKFRYNEYGNPDAAVAIFFQDIYAKKGETISIGAVLSTSRLKASQIKITEAVSSEYTLPQVPTVVTNYVTNTIGSSNVTLTITSNTNRQLNDLNSQMELLERAALLIDRLDSLLKNTNVQAVLGDRESSLGKGLDGSVPKNPRGNPFDNDKTAVKQPTSTNQPEKTNYPQQQYTGALTTNIIQTNIYYTNSTLSEAEIQKLKEERDRVQKQYEEKIQSLEVYYKELLKKQENEFKEVSSDYKNMLNEKEKKKAKDKKMTDLDNTILSLDKRIEVIGELLELNLDFESMPPEKLEAARSLISELETKIK